MRVQGKWQPVRLSVTATSVCFQNDDNGNLFLFLTHSVSRSYPSSLKASSSLVTFFNSSCEH